MYLGFEVSVSKNDFFPLKEEWCSETLELAHFFFLLFTAAQSLVNPL